MVTKKIVLNGVDEAVNLFGYLDSNIHKIERDCKVQIFIRHASGSGANWPSLSVRGSSNKVERALNMIDKLRENLKKQSSQQINNLSLIHI